MNDLAVKPIGKPWLLAAPAVLWLVLFGLATLKLR